MNIPDEVRDRILECHPRYGRASVARDLKVSMGRAKNVIKAIRAEHAAGEEVETLTAVDPYEMIDEAERRQTFKSIIDPKE
jgi:hypothetical protein